MKRDNRRRRTWETVLLVMIFLLAAAAVVIGVGWFFLPWYNAQSTMPQDGVLYVDEQESGALVLSWPRAPQADCYCLEMLVPAASEEEEPEQVYQSIVNDTCCTIPVPMDPEQAWTIRVSSMVAYTTLLGETYRYGDEPLEATTNFLVPEITDLLWTPYSDDKSVVMDMETENCSYLRLYTLQEDEQLTEVLRSTQNKIKVQFSPDGQLPEIPFGGSVTLALDAVRENGKVIFRSYPFHSFTVDRDNLLDRNLDVQLQELADNMISLSWRETKGEYYEVQRMQPGDEQWQVMFTVPGDGERSHTSHHLDPCEEYLYRVVAVGGEVIPGSEFAAISDEFAIKTKESAIFATIWPTKDLQAYADPAKTAPVGTVVTGQAYTVLEEVDDMFAVRLDDRICYIESTFCLINLPEYMGDLCAYKITNSDESKFLMHEFKLDGLTGKVIRGYSDIKLEDGSYLVPLLYPTAQKLVTAAHIAEERGYRLKIYDAFRPNEATTLMYSAASKMLEKNLPEKTYTGTSVSKMQMPEVPEGEDHTSLTYADVMLGEYTLNYYVARGKSNHNLGIALDLTLEELDTGKEVRMQTSMHDLSQYSALNRNNRASNNLQKIMKEAGFGTLPSEWWHFNDNETKNAYSLEVVVKGLSAEGWVADDLGWRYRTAEGTYLTGVTETIGEESFTFDDQGYLMTN